MPSLPRMQSKALSFVGGSSKSNKQRLFVDWADLHSLYTAVTYACVE